MERQRAVSRLDSIDQSERTWRFTRGDNAIEEAARFAELATSACDAACREAAVLAVNELAENVLKYGATDHPAGAATLAIAALPQVLRIRVRNPIKSRSDAEGVTATIARITTSPDVKELYRKRLAELFANPALPRAQLGLLRLAFEGRFRLTCNYQHPFLELVAERTCDDVK
jgi:hypothetical protein